MPVTNFPRIISANSKKFVNFLIERHLLKEGFRQILSGQSMSNIDRYIVSHRLIDDDVLYQAYADFYQIPYISLVGKPIDPKAVRLLPENITRSFMVVIFRISGLELDLAVGLPALLQKNAPELLVRLRQQKGLRINLSVAPKSDVLAVINKVYQHQEPKPAEKVEELAEPTKEVRAIEPPTHQTASRSPEEKQLIKNVAAVEKEKKVDLREKQIEPEVLHKIPYPVAKKYRIVVFEAEQSKSQYEPSLIKVGSVDLNDPHVKEILSFIESRHQILIDRYTIDEASFQAALKQYPEFKEDTEPAEGPPAEISKPSEVGKEMNQPTSAEQPPLSVSQPPTPVTTHTSPPPPPNKPAPPAQESSMKPVVAENDQNKSNPNAAAPMVPITALSKEGFRLTSEDIINRPEQASNAELKELANEQQANLENQNLDALLKKSVDSVDDLAKIIQRGVVPEIVAATLFLAIRMSASDVHIEAGKDEIRFRFRIDGILHDIIRVPAFLLAPLVSRVKILSRMKIDEQRIPQDGRFDVIIDQRQVDLRVSTLPTVHGEKVVMRLLDKSQGIKTLEQLGVTGTNFDRLVENIQKPYGVILSTGPTGSGKSTTLYAVLNRISKPGVNIITLEDPVEYELPGINQSQVKPEIGFSFAEGLRSVLRQDPNVIMVGEIRDLETAAMATHAALTGHLVLSTLHTNDSAGALPRLINMGVEPFLITSSMNCVIGQRLVRKICENCREKVEIPPAVLNFIKKELEALPTGKVRNIGLDQLVFYHGKGCDQCSDGYRGRIGIFEVLTLNEEIENLAVSKAPATAIKKAAIKGGMITMTQDGLIKALKGQTTIDEVLRVTTTNIKEMPGNDS